MLETQAMLKYAAAFRVTSYAASMQNFVRNVQNNMPVQVLVYVKIWTRIRKKNMQNMLTSLFCISCFAYTYTPHSSRAAAGGPEEAGSSWPPRRLSVGHGHGNSLPLIAVY